MCILIRSRAKIQPILLYYSLYIYIAYFNVYYEYIYIYYIFLLFNTSDPIKYPFSLGNRRERADVNKM